MNAGYSKEPTYLIGPRYFALYLKVLKVVLAIAMTISLIVSVTDNVVEFSGDQAVINLLLSILGDGIIDVFSAGIQAFFWVTLVFAGLERGDQTKIQTSLTKLSNDVKLEPQKKEKKKAISKFELVIGLIGTIIWAIVYFNSHTIVGVYEKGKDGWEFVTPAFNQEVLNSYWFIVAMVIGLSIILLIYKWVIGKWTIKVALFNAFCHFFNSVVFIIIVSTPNLVTVSFKDYMIDLLSLSKESHTGVYWGVIFSLLLFVAIDTFEGFRKAKIR